MLPDIFIHYFQNNYLNRAEYTRNFMIIGLF